MRTDLRKKRLLVGLTELGWVAGILMAGSDGPFAPWMNGFGAGLFFCASLVLGKLLPKLEKNKQHAFALKRIRPKVSLGHTHHWNPKTYKFHNAHQTDCLLGHLPRCIKSPIGLLLNL